MERCFEILFNDVQFKCFFWYEPGSSLILFSFIIGGPNPGQYVEKVEEAKITEGIVSAVINTFDPKRGIYAPPQLKA